MPQVAARAVAAKHPIIVDAIIEIAKAAGHNACAGEGFSWSTAGDQVVVFSYATPSNFSKIWGFEDDEQNSGGLESVVSGIHARASAEPLTIVIIWDGMPNEPNSVIAVEPYVTPYDWALGLSLRLYKSARKATALPRIRLMIVDVWSDLADRGFAHAQFYSYHNVVPWIQDYSFGVSKELTLVRAALDVYCGHDTGIYSRLRQALLPGERNQEAFIDDLGDLTRVLTTFPEDDIDDIPERLQLLQTLGESWSQQLVRAKDRHSVANLVGPWLLLDGVSDRQFRNRLQTKLTTDSLTRRALREVIQIADLQSANEIPLDVVSALLQTKNENETICLAPRVLLVDDSYEIGYDHIIAHILFGSRYRLDDWQRSANAASITYPAAGALRCESTLKSILGTLRHRAQRSPGDWSSPQSIAIPHCDILLLDLRVWASDEARQNCMKDLVAVCDTLNIGELVDPVRGDMHVLRAYEAARQFAAGNTANELEAITLLPLLLSHLDPSLPVVLFSSTHQKRVMDMLGHRANIITRFAKPVFSGYAEKLDTAEALSDLRSALQQAIELHEARIVWKRIIAASWAWSPPIFTRQRASEAESGRRWTWTKQTARLSITDQQLRIQLAQMYRHYLIRGECFDLLSAPYRFLESALMQDPERDGLSTSIYPPSWSWHQSGLEHNRICMSLKEIRNRAVHRWMPPSHPDELTSLRKAVILEFLLLLDFIEQRTFPFEGIRSALEDDLREYTSSLCVNQRLPSGIDSQTLSKQATVPDSAFVLHTIARHVRDTADHRGLFVSEQTSRVMRVLLREQKCTVQDAEEL